MDRKKNWLPSNGRFLPSLLIVLIGIAFYLALSNLGPLQQRMDDLVDVISPFLAGLAIAYLLNTPTVFLEQKVFYKFRFRRGLSILTAYLLACALLGVLVTLILPQVVNSVINLANNIEAYLADFNAWARSIIREYELDVDELLGDLFFSYQDLLSKAADIVTTQLPNLFNYGMLLGNLLVDSITALISSIYMLAGKERLLNQMRRLVYALFPQTRANWVLSVCSTANRTFSGFITGKLLDSFIMGILCFILCSILGIPLPLLISVIVGVTNVIPFFGPLIGAIPCAAVLLIIDPWAALRFLALILALQQFDGNILGPRILGDSTGLSPIWVLVSIVVGGGLFGFPGMLLGVPTFAVLYALTRDWVNRRLWEKNITVPDHASPEPPEEEAPPDE